MMKLNGNTKATVTLLLGLVMGIIFPRLWEASLDNAHLEEQVVSVREVLAGHLSDYRQADQRLRHIEQDVAAIRAILEEDGD